MERMINEFRGENYFLSNFYMAPVTYEGITYTNNEAAFQAQKCDNCADRAAFADLDPSRAKKKGRHVRLRKDWENVKRTVMYELLTAKFTQNPVLRVKLQATGTAHLEEGNTWGDRIWGTVDGVGENWLGKLLMQVRTDLHKDRELIILERENGMYGGYEVRDIDIAQLFNTHDVSLFFSIKQYTDRGYTVTCLDRTCEKEFMKDRYTIL